MAKVLRNSKAYDSEDVNVLINGILLDITEIKYSVKKERQNNHSLGSDRPTSWSGGKREFEGSISCLLENGNLLESSSNGDLLSITPFVINVSFVNEYNKIIVDKITAMFNNQGREVNGDMGLQFTYELHVLDVEFDVI